MLESLFILTYLFTQPESVKPKTHHKFVIKSPAFHNHETIPQPYTCWGQRLTPPLHWSGAPKSTKSFALLILDEDVPRSRWYQWVVFNIPAHQSTLPSNPQFMPVANNSWGKPQYHSPCPKTGMHHYRIELYALDTTFPTSEHDPITLRKNMQNHILGVAKILTLAVTPPGFRGAHLLDKQSIPHRPLFQ